MSKTTIVDQVTPPPLPVTVMVRLPRAADLPTSTIMVDVPAPGAAMVPGLKVTPTALPAPDADKAMGASKPPAILVLIVVVPELSRSTLSALGVALMSK